MSTPSLTLIKTPPQPFSLPPDQAEQLEEILDGYKARRVGTKSNRKRSFADEVAVVHDLIRFTGKAPWTWGETDFDRWCLHLGTERMLAVASQRKYQIAIKTFLDYLSTTQAYVNAIQSRYGIRPRQICHSGNLIPHILNRELKRSRPMMAKQQLEAMLHAVGEHIDTAEAFRSKARYPLQRDYALFALMFHLGLRVSEACHLDLDDFQYEPESGCLFANVAGKGSRGSDAKHRNVPALSTQVAKLLIWYLEEVRPHLTSTRHPNERALFLSERGTRITRGAIENRFQNALGLAGMDGLGLTPHSLRHGSITKIQMEGLSTEAARRFAGHEHSSTTQGYTHVGDDYVLDQFKQFLRKNQGDRP